MLNVDHHPLSSKDMLEGGGKTIKIRLLKQKSATSHFSSYHDKIIHHKCLLFFCFFPFFLFFFAHFVINDFFPCYIPNAGIIVLARGCHVHTRQTTQSLHLGTTNHSLLQDRRK